MEISRHYREFMESRTRDLCNILYTYTCLYIALGKPEKAPNTLSETKMEAGSSNVTPFQSRDVFVKPLLGCQVSLGECNLFGYDSIFEYRQLVRYISHPDNPHPHR